MDGLARFNLNHKYESIRSPESKSEKKRHDLKSKSADVSLSAQGGIDAYRDIRGRVSKQVSNQTVNKCKSYVSERDSPLSKFSNESGRTLSHSYVSLQKPQLKITESLEEETKQFVGVKRPQLYITESSTEQVKSFLKLTPPKLFVVEASEEETKSFVDIKRPNLQITESSTEEVKSFLKLTPPKLFAVETSEEEANQFVDIKRPQLRITESSMEEMKPYVNLTPPMLHVVETSAEESKPFVVLKPPQLYVSESHTEQSLVFEKSILPQAPQIAMLQAAPKKIVLESRKQEAISVAVNTGGKTQIDATLKQVLEGATEHLGKVQGDIIQIVKNFDAIETDFRLQSKSLSPEALNKANSRMAELKEMVVYARTLSADGFKDEITRRLVNFRLEIKNEGITGGFPASLTHSAVDGMLLDQSGKVFDTLRNEGKGDSATEKFIKFCRARGGNYNLISKTTSTPVGPRREGWYHEQATSTQSNMSLMVKYKTQGFRDVGNPVWKSPADFGKIKYQKQVAKCQTTDMILEQTILMFMAFNMELLHATDIPGKNADGTITVYRTESKDVMEKNKIYNISDSEEYSMPREFLTSTSIIQPVVIMGGEVTQQNVPFHRFVGTYLTELIAGNKEKEFLCMLDGIPFKYTDSILS